LDPRAWLLWGLAASLPPLVGRNPFPLVATLVAVLGVRAAWVVGQPTAASWGTLLRLAVVFALIAVAFNLLTVPVGDRVIANLPDQVPIVGGVLTLNALVYGLLSGLALLTLVTVGTTLGAVLDWTGVLRLLPARLTGVAVAGSVAFAFVPQTVTAFREIREAQVARGFRPRGARALIPILVPLLDGGMERALTLAEALEARAFGSAPGGAVVVAPWRQAFVALGLTGGVTGGYLLAIGNGGVALVCLAAAGGALFLGGRERRGGRMGRSRFRQPRWQRADSAVAAAALVVIAIAVATIWRSPGGLRYEPYPSLAAPRIDLLLLVSLTALLAPIFVAPRS
jgi:energy-coupling factor transport system permease protein